MQFPSVRQASRQSEGDISLLSAPIFTLFVTMYVAFISTHSTAKSVKERVLNAGCLLVRLDKEANLVHQVLM